MTAGALIQARKQAKDARAETRLWYEMANLLAVAARESGHDGVRERECVLCQSLVAFDLLKENYAPPKEPTNPRRRSRQ